MEGDWDGVGGDCCGMFVDGDVEVFVVCVWMLNLFWIDFDFVYYGE